MERNYSTTEIEALVIHDGIKIFTPYLWGIHFTVLTDHRALTYIMKNKTMVPKIARWQLLLVDFDFEIKFKLGKSNVVPDFLSHREFNEEERVNLINETEENPVLNEEILRTEQRNDSIC